MSQIQPKLIGTAPSKNSSKNGAGFSEAVAAAARCADDNGWEAMLSYSDHRQADPWLVAQLILQSTKNLTPLVAVQPLDAHPATIARTVSTLTFLYERPLYLNMVAGGFPKDLTSIGDASSHDRRYERLVEYTKIIQELLRRQTPFSYSGEFFNLTDSKTFPVPDDLFPTFTVAGSSAAGLAAAKTIGARAIQYLRPASEYDTSSFDSALDHGARLGVIVRETSEEAWAVAKASFPESPEGAILREYSSQISDSVWVKELDREITVKPGDPYWLGPYRQFQSPCPFLVGSTDAVAEELFKYMRLGIRTFLLESPEDDSDTSRITSVFSIAALRARDRATAPK